MIQFLFFGFVYFSRSVKYFRLDSRSPEEIRAAGGFKPKGNDLNLLNHAVNRHQNTLSGYVSFTDDEHKMVQQFSTVLGRKESWLYAIEVDGNGLPSVLDGLRTLYSPIIQALQVVDPDFPNMDIETALSRQSELVFQYLTGGPPGTLSLIGELNTLLNTYSTARKQGDHVSQHIPLTAIQSAARIALREDGGYDTLESVPMGTLTPAPSEVLPPGATDASVLVTPMTLAQIQRMKRIPHLNMCGKGCCILQSDDNPEVCPDYMYQVVTPPSYQAAITFHTDDQTSAYGINYGQELQKWTTNANKQNVHCALYYDADNHRNMTQCQILDQSGGKLIGVKQIEGNISYLGSRNGGQGWVDVNGDGNVDYCRIASICGNTGVYCDISNATSFESERWGGDVGDRGFRNQRWWADVNGDGCDDFCRLTFKGIQCSLGDKSIDTVFKNFITFTDDNYGISNSRAWADIEGTGRNSFCRLVYDKSRIRCNVLQSNGSWIRYESQHQSGGYPGYRYWIKLNGPRTAFCRVTGDYRANMTCTDFIRGEFQKEIEFALPAIPGGEGDITFVDLGGRGLSDICVLGSDRKLYCKLNLGNGRWSQPFSPPGNYAKGYGNFGDGQQVIFPRRGNYAQYCRNVGLSTLSCMKISFQAEAVIEDAN